jgi:superfamily II DNA or RNA helicase
MAIGSLVAVPELAEAGPARLISERGKNQVIRFLASKAEMTQEALRIVRYCLLPGTRVRVVAEGVEHDGVVAAAPIRRETRTGLLVYAVHCPDRERTVREDAIVLVSAPRDAGEQLTTAAFHDLGRPVSASGVAQPSEPWGPQSFCAREELLAWRDRAWTATGGVIALAGARVRPLPHQLLTAQRVLADRQVRFLLADEVGLGKTIEAGLVIQSLLAMNPRLRVLIIVPGALVSQWFLELYVKFGGRTYLMLDHERLRNYSGNPWKDEQFVLASSRAVEEMDARNAVRLAQSSWDMLVVDECHRMQPGGILYQRVMVLSKSISQVLLLSATPARSHADAYLAILALLQPQVYRPDDLESFQAKLDAHAKVVELLGETKDAAATEAQRLAKAWRKLLSGDARAAKRAAALAAAKPDDFLAARDALVAHVREHHQLDHRVIRHRRQVLARLSQASGVKGLALTSRSLERVTYRPDAAELAVRAALRAYQAALMKKHARGHQAPPRLAHWLLQVELAVGSHPQVAERLLAMRAAVLEDPEEYRDYRACAQKGETTAHVLRHDLSENEIAAHVAVSAACHADPKTEAKPLAALREAVAAWLKHQPARLKALIQRLKAFWVENPQEKVLIFTSQALAVRRLAEALGQAFGEGAVETFGAHQDTVVREEAARRFREDDGCPLLICDPLGGEGRNFQFVSVVAHYDLPWSVAAVEQRIGRVDRLGRDGEVPSWVLVSAGEAAEGCVDAAWVEVLAEAAGVFTASSSGLEFICDAVETRALDAVLDGGAPALRALQGELVKLVQGERDSRDALADELFHEEAAIYAEAARFAESINAFAAPKEAVCRWIRGMGGAVRHEEDHPRAFHLRTRYHQKPERGVFDRETALDKPELSYFALGNGLIDVLIDDATNAAWCRATAWRRPPVPGLARWEGLRVSYELTCDLAPIAAAGLGLDSLRRLFRLVPPKRLLAFIRIDPKAATAVVETETATLATLKEPFDAHHGDAALSLATSREFWTRPLLAGRHDQIVAWQQDLGRALDAARRQAEALLPGERDAALDLLDRSFAESLDIARAQADAARASLGRKHPDALRAEAESDDELRQSSALTAALQGARLEIAGVAYVVVA